MMNGRSVVLASPRGFCAGVRRAIDVIEAALRRHPAPLYCLNEIVHNRQIVEDLRARGVVFVTSIDDVPEGRVIVFSAHGVAPAVRAAAAQRQLNVIDATCPFVEKVHREVRRFAERGYAVLLVGHRKHDEVVGVAGEAPDAVTVLETLEEARTVAVDDPGRIAVVSQTTLSVEETGAVTGELKRRFPAIHCPAASDICYATSNRQQAVRELAARTPLILILGSPNSSNSRRLVEVARAAGAEARLIDRLDVLETFDLQNVPHLGLSAGASTPESFIGAVLDALRQHGFDRLEELRTTDEDVHFSLPPDLA